MLQWEIGRCLLLVPRRRVNLREWKQRAFFKSSYFYHIGEKGAVNSFPDDVVIIASAYETAKTISVSQSLVLPVLSGSESSVWMEVTVHKPLLLWHNDRSPLSLSVYESGLVTLDISELLRAQTSWKSNDSLLCYFSHGHTMEHHHNRNRDYCSFLPIF